MLISLKTDREKPSNKHLPSIKKIKNKNKLLLREKNIPPSPFHIIILVKNSPVLMFMCEYYADSEGLMYRCVPRYFTFNFGFRLSKCKHFDYPDQEIKIWVLFTSTPVPQNQTMFDSLFSFLVYRYQKKLVVV